MSRKTTECYSAVFDFIEQRLFNLEPTEFMTDYEDGMRLAIKKKWPNVTIRGCWFHFCRAIRRRCGKHGLFQLIKKNAGARAIQNSLMSLPLLSANQIKEGFKSVKAIARKKRLLKRFKPVFTYFEGYWLKQNERNSISVIDLNMRTTSSLEALNSAIQHWFPSNPNIYSFIDHLRLYESIKSSDLYQLSTEEISSKQLERRRTKDKNRDEKIKKLTSSLKIGEISVAGFLEAMSDRSVLPTTSFKKSKPIN